MRITKVQSFMLFALGECYEEFEKRFSNKPMTLSMNKTEFIDVVHRTRIASKKDRAVYKNLEDLEKLKLVAYNNKTLSLTKKGKKMFLTIQRDLDPYLETSQLFHSDTILKYTAKKQTILKE